MRRDGLHCKTGVRPAQPGLHHRSHDMKCKLPPKSCINLSMRNRQFHAHPGMRVLDIVSSEPSELAGSSVPKINTFF